MHEILSDGGLASTQRWVACFGAERALGRSTHGANCCRSKYPKATDAGTATGSSQRRRFRMARPASEFVARDHECAISSASSRFVREGTASLRFDDR